MSPASVFLVLPSLSGLAAEIVEEASMWPKFCRDIVIDN